MARRPLRRHLLVLLALILVACQPAASTPGESAAASKRTAAQSGAPSRIVIGVTETVEKQNPYADSVGLMYGIWCEVLGCLVSYDFQAGEYVGALAESWKVENPTSWIFNLRRGVTWHDGSPFTAADVLHSFDRIEKDPESRQKQNISAVESVEAVDDHTVRVKTKEPTSSLLSYFSDLLIITQKAQYDQFGDDVWKQKPIGTGPYLFEELLPNERIVIKKNPNWWGGPVQGPDEVVYRVMREDEVRVTALLNNELQIAQFIPPIESQRVAASGDHKLVVSDSVDVMFLAMQPRPPFDNKLVRQAVAHAIDREAIIKNVLQDYATLLNGPIGPGQYGYNPDLQPRYTYNPEKAKELLAQAGFPNGIDVELSTPVGRYIMDKQVTEAMVPMLNAVGIRTKLLTPEWSTLWADVQAGKVPFYYMGRGSFLDPGLPLSQYFETGVSPRIGYSNPQLDALFKEERSAFEPNDRKQKLTEIMSLITEEAPAHFLWKPRMIWGMAKNIEYTPRPDGFIFANQIRVQ